MLSPRIETLLCPSLGHMFIEVPDKLIRDAKSDLIQTRVSSRSPGRSGDLVPTAWVLSFWTGADAGPEGLWEASSPWSGTRGSSCARRRWPDTRSKNQNDAMRRRGVVTKHCVRSQHPKGGWDSCLNSGCFSFSTTNPVLEGRTRFLPRPAGFVAAAGVGSRAPGAGSCAEVARPFRCSLRTCCCTPSMAAPGFSPNAGGAGKAAINGRV